jgi:hypothetical protein
VRRPLGSHSCSATAFVTNLVSSATTTPMFTATQPAAPGATHPTARAPSMSAVALLMLSSDVSQMLPDTLTSSYIMPLHRRHARQHRPERLQRRHFSRQLSVRQRRRASASSSDAKIPSAEAARAAPVSFMALPRVMASLPRAIASSSKDAAPPWSVLVSNANPPFELPQAHPVCGYIYEVSTHR